MAPRLKLLYKVLRPRRRQRTSFVCKPEEKRHSKTGQTGAGAGVESDGTRTPALSPPPRGSSGPVPSRVLEGSKTYISALGSITREVPDHPCTL